MIILKKMISHGSVRACYYNPQNPNTCIKIALKTKHIPLLKKELKNNELFQKKLSPYVPFYYRICETNKGPRLECELIKDSDNNLSLRLKDYLKKNKTLSKQLYNQFDDFFEKLFIHKIWFYDFNLENFLIQKTKKYERLVFIDTKSFNRNNSWSCLKLEYIIPYLAKNRMRRRIVRFYKRNHLPIPKSILK